MIYVAGTGSFSAEISGIAQESGLIVAGLIELEDQSRAGLRLHGLPVLAMGGPPDGSARVLLGVGGRREPRVRVLHELGWSFTSLVHPRAHVASSARIGPGTIVFPGVVLGAAAVLGEHVVVSRGALVGHHTKVGSLTTLNPGANVGGNAEIGDGAFLGMGCTVVDGVRVGTEAVVGAGAVVLEHVAPGLRVQGVPARPFDPVR